MDLLSKTNLKRCSGCGENKDKNTFHKNKKRKDGLQPFCKECAEKYDKEYREKNKEKKRAYRREYYIKNQKQERANEKKYRLKNKDQIKAYQKKYRESEEGKKSFKKSNLKYRARIKGATPSNFHAAEVFQRDGYICQNCRCKTRPDFKNTVHPKYPNLDHIIPLSKGGDHSMRNTQCLCRDCNIKKNNGQKQDQLLLFGI